MARPPFHPTIGSVPYLNALPLVEGLRASVRCVAPGRMPPLLKKGTLDAALMPTGALLKNEFDIIDTLGIASDGPARTVLLHQKNPDHPPASLALDRHSRTSALLARFLIEERFGARPRLISYDPRKTPPAVILKKVDAALTIGDVSFRPPPAGCRGSRGMIEPSSMTAEPVTSPPVKTP